MELYTRHQLLVLLVLVAVAGAGLAIGHWKRGHPDMVERLERLDRDPPPPAAPDRARSPAISRHDAARAHGIRREPSEDAPVSPEPSGTGAPRPEPPAETGRLDLNRASSTELMRLPGVGRVLAERIVEARAVRAFESLDDLTRVRGLTRARLERVRPLVTVAP